MKSWRIPGFYWKPRRDPKRQKCVPVVLCVLSTEQNPWQLSEQLMSASSGVDIVKLSTGDSKVQVRGVSSASADTGNWHEIGSSVPDVREKFELLIPSYSTWINGVTCDLTIENINKQARSGHNEEKEERKLQKKYNSQLTHRILPHIFHEDG